MKPKFLEIRDRATTIPALAFDISEKDGYLAERAGFGNRLIFVVHLTKQVCSYDSYGWGGKTSGRTMREAHRYISEHWNEIENEEVIDVEFILGETTEKKTSERLWKIGKGKKFRINGTFGVEEITREDILRIHFESWSESMKRAKLEDKISEDLCVEEYCITNWAWRIE